MSIQNMWLILVLWSIFQTEATISKTEHTLIAGYGETTKRIYLLGKDTLQTIDMDDGYSQASHIFTNISLPIDPTHFIQPFVKDSILHWLTPPILRRFDMSSSQQIDDLLFPEVLESTDGKRQLCVAFNGK